MRFLQLILITIFVALATNDSTVPVSDTMYIPIPGESPTVSGGLKEVDLQSWSHPTRVVLEKSSLSITKVILKDDVYPLFHVTNLPSLLTTPKETEAQQLFVDLFSANGHWPFSLIDISSGDTIKVEGDREKRAITTIEINGNPQYFETLKKKHLARMYEAIFSSNEQTKREHLSVTEDLNGDNSPEVVSLVADVVTLYSWNMGLEKIGELDPDLSTMYTVDSIKTIQIDESKDEKSIILYLHHTGSGAEGYSLFSYTGKKIKRVETNFPSTTGAGNRSLADMDDDNVLEAVTSYEIEGKQHRIIAMYQEIGSKDDLYTTTGVYGPKGFVHPKTAEDLILSFLEAVSLSAHFDCDFAKEISELSTSNMKYDSKSPLYSILNPSSIAAYPPSLELKENFKNGNEVLYTFRLSSDPENRSYYCSVVKDGEKLKIDSIE